MTGASLVVDVVVDAVVVVSPPPGDVVVVTPGPLVVPLPDPAPSTHWLLPAAASGDVNRQH